MKCSKKYSVFLIILTLTFLRCSPASDSIQKNDLPKVVLLLPVKGATEISINSELGWKGVEEATNYEVQLSDQNNFSNLILNLYVDSTSLELNGLPYNTALFWRVRAVKNDKTGPWSQVSDFETEPEPNQPIPTSTTLQSPENDSVNQPLDNHLKWIAVVNATIYQLQVATAPNFKNLFIEEFLGKTSYDLTELDSGQTYYWRVLVHIEGTETEWSDVWNFKTIGISIPPVTLLNPQNHASDQPTDVRLEWEEIEGIMDYHLQVSKTNTFTNTVIDEIVDQTNFEITGLNYDETYYWRVEASESDKWSDTWSFTTETLPLPPLEGFVSVSNSNFLINGQVFRFAGTNAYYLPNYEKIDSRFVTNTLDTFEETGITVVRMWAFYDGYDCGYSRQDASENVIQTAPGQYSESALKDLDNVIAKGKNRGIRFLLTFINYWDDLGGICQYNTWDGASNPSTNMSHFINSTNTQKWFKDYIKMLLNRKNTVTGIAYKKEPAIFGWEIMNEGRFGGQNPKILRDWYRNIAKYIKSIDSNHLVTTGEEGFDENAPSEYSVNQYSNTYVLRAEEGTSYIMNTSIPEIDFGSAHWYPADWGFGSNVNQNMIHAQHAWIKDHMDIAANLGKPFVLGEYGYAGWGNQATLTIYEDLWEQAEEVDLDGSLLWQLTTNYVKCYEFGGNICWPEGRQDTNLYNSFKNHIQKIN